MFKKLLSNLPFNPGLIDQVSFYAKRLKREAFVRRLGFLFMVLAVLVQVFAVVSPPQPTLASSSSDLISGGVRSAADAASHCRNNTAGYGDILSHFNISCDNIATASVTSLSPSSYNNQLYSMGRNANGSAGETPVTIAGKTFWLHKLSSWAKYNYQVLKGTNKEGKTFYLILCCGNLVLIGLPPPPTPVCSWNAAILSTDAKCFEPCPVASKSGLSKTDPKCFVPCPVNGKSDIPQSDPQCFEPCPVKGKTNLSSKDPGCFEPCPVAGKASIPKNSVNCFEPCPYNSSISRDSLQCFEPCPYNSAIASKDPACKPCEAAQTRDDKTSCLKLSKTAKNDTQKITDANGTTAKAGDTIVYTLSVKNEGKVDVTGFVIQENINDALDYSDVVSLDGGTKDKDNIVSYPAVTIKPSQTVTKQITVKIKDPIPGTPISASDPGHFDLNMVNVYGNVISVKLPAGVVKSIEITSTTLPNTGPGTSLMIAFVTLSFVGYFFARSRLLARELALVKADHSVAGVSSV